MKPARVKHWWRVASSQVQGAKTYHTLNVLGKRDRRIVVTSRLDGRDVACLCLNCRKHDCAHAIFVHELAQALRAQTSDEQIEQRIARMFVETPAHELSFMLAGAHFGKPMKDVPRAELLRGHAYYSNPKRAYLMRSKEIVAAINETLRYLDARVGTDFEQFPEALRDDPNERLPWDSE